MFNGDGWTPDDKEQRQGDLSDTTLDAVAKAQRFIDQALGAPLIARGMTELNDRLNAIQAEQAEVDAALAHRLP